MMMPSPSQVPKFLSDRWKKSGPGGEVGKLKITKRENVKQTDVVFRLNDELNTNEPASADDMQVPTEYKFSLTPIGTQTLAILSTEQIPEPVNEDEEAAAAATGGGGTVIPKFNEGRVSIVGKVIQRAECRPMSNDSSYLNHIRNRMEVGNRPQQSVVQLDKNVISYKPTSTHQHNILYEMKRKEEGKKIRGDKEKVMDMLFAAFESYQYYNVKDLTFLKEILKEICIYNMKAPNKNTWELKPEFRHYKKQHSSGADGSS